MDIGPQPRCVDQRVVASGRDTFPGVSSDQRLGGKYMAHAEMNLLGGMSSYDADGFQLLSTLQPCLMCAATALFLAAATEPRSCTH